MLDLPPVEHHYQLPSSKPWMDEFRAHLPTLPPDPLSNANPKQAVTTHLIWDVSVDFSNKEFFAIATYSYRNLEPGNTTIVLDASNLLIEEILVDGQSAPYTIVSSEIPSKPDALNIAIPADQTDGTIAIRYRTSPQATGIFWIDPEHTEGKEHPLMYTLFQPTEGASAIPGQHSPQVRLTYEVHVNTNNPDLIALSSVSNNPTTNSLNGEYRNMKMSRPIPLYLLSLNAGHLNFHRFDERTGVYAEPEALEEAKTAFEKLPEYLKAAEEICGPYHWGAYTPIQLGWQFPYGAMEHPCASTFGKICNDWPHVVAHELAHSWTGNDITNCNWQQFFWNEGATTFLEYQITEKIWGTDFASMLFISQLKEVMSAMKQLQDKPELLKLCVDGDQYALTTIPYVKGALFFFMLQEALGKEVFSAFLKDYMSVFFQNNMSEERFLAFLQLFLEQEQGMHDFEQFLAEHQIIEWLHGTDIPSNAPTFHSKLVDLILAETESVLRMECNAETIKNWDVIMQSIFLHLLRGQVNKEHLELLEQTLHYTQSKNLSIQSDWILACIEAQHLPPPVQELIISYLLKRNSVYDADRISSLLNQTEEGKQLIQRILDADEGKLFPLTRQAIEKNFLKEG